MSLPQEVKDNIERLLDEKANCCCTEGGSYAWIENKTQLSDYIGEAVDEWLSQQKSEGGKMLFEAVPVEQELPGAKGMTFVLWDSSSEKSTPRAVFFDNGKFWDQSMRDGEDYEVDHITHWLRPYTAPSPKVEQETVGKMAEALKKIISFQNSDENISMEPLAMLCKIHSEASAALSEYNKSNQQC